MVKDEKYLSRDEAAALLFISTRTLDRLAAKDFFTRRKVFGKSIFFLDEIEAYRKGIDGGTSESDLKKLRSKKGRVRRCS